MRPFEETSINITPVEFEKQVKTLLEKFDQKVKHLEFTHDDKLINNEGEFQIDVKVTFEFLGAEFVLLVECKKHNSAIKRETVQILKDKVQILGAQKGMLVSASGFQKGAIEYAKNHGIALVRIIRGEMTFETKSLIKQKTIPDWIDFPEFSFFWVKQNECDSIEITNIDNHHLPDFESELLQ